MPWQGLLHLRRRGLFLLPEVFGSWETGRMGIAGEDPPEDAGSRREDVRVQTGGDSHAQPGKPERGGLLCLTVFCPNDPEVSGQARSPANCTGADCPAGVVLGNA